MPAHRAVCSPRGPPPATCANPFAPTTKSRKPRDIPVRGSTLNGAPDTLLHRHCQNGAACVACTRRKPQPCSSPPLAYMLPTRCDQHAQGKTSQKEGSRASVQFPPKIPPLMHKAIALFKTLDADLCCRQTPGPCLSASEAVAAAAPKNVIDPRCRGAKPGAQAWTERACGSTKAAGANQFGQDVRRWTSAARTPRRSLPTLPSGAQLHG